MKLAEFQPKWFVAYLLGEYALPSRMEMQADIEHEREQMFRRYVKSKRLTMQVDYDDYLLGLKKEIRNGQSHARKSGNQLPVPPNARAYIS